MTLIRKRKLEKAGQLTSPVLTKCNSRDGWECMIQWLSMLESKEKHKGLIHNMAEEKQKVQDKY